LSWFSLRIAPQNPKPQNPVKIRDKFLKLNKAVMNLLF